jgi:hypothetical protein
MLGARHPNPRLAQHATIVGAVLLVALTALRAGPGSEPPVRRPPATAASAPASPAVAAGCDGPVVPPHLKPPQPAQWRPGKAVPIAVRQGRAEFDVATTRPGSRTLVIVSAMARGAGPFPLRLDVQPARAAHAPALAPQPLRRDVRLKPVALGPPPEVEHRTPASQRTFHLMVRDGDVASASNYLAVRGELRAVGERVQVYVDAEDRTRVGADVLGDVVATFDGHVFPTAATRFGWARDVDGDGRFTVLMSRWLTRLAGGRHAVDGYVRGADFDPTLAPPFGNRCDMMYLSTDLEPGPHLRTVLAHEYTHAVTLCAKVFSTASSASAGGSPGPWLLRPHLEEEGWLDEALAHLVEDLHGFARSNLDYRISAFLSQPVRYRLVVEDYYAADLFRSHGNRGGTYLFLRWCADKFGPALLPALIRSELRGTANLEAATGVPFAELYRQWTVALFLSGLERGGGGGEGDVHGAGAYTSLDIRGRLDGWDLAGPRPLEVAPGGAGARWSATGTSTQFVVVEPPAGPEVAAVTVAVAGPVEADLQVTAVPLPAGLARIELDVRPVAASDGSVRRLHVSLRERQGAGVQLSSLAWEPLVPSANPRSARFRRGALDPAGIVRAFGSATLAAHGTLETEAIPLPDAPDDVPLIVKVVGNDAGGRRIAAWAEVPPVAAEGEEEEHPVPASAER